MRSHWRFCFGVAAAFALAAPAAAQVNQNIKTPPLQDSDTFVIPISIHNTVPNPPWAGWAGAIMKVHLLDAGELDVDAIHPVLPMRVGVGGPVFAASSPLVNPLGPRSNNVQSVPVELTFWHPNAQNSGVPINASQNLPLASGFFHAKGSNPAGNSDVDLTLMFWNIWHIVGPPPGGTTNLVLQPSDRIWVNSTLTNVAQLHTVLSQNRFGLPHPTPFDPQGHWLHIVNTITFHLSALDQSVFYATLLNVGTLGVEHVPEPTSALLIGGGVLALAASRSARRRRMAIA